MIDDLKKEVKALGLIINLLTIIFSVLSILNKWSDNFICYTMLASCIINLILYLIIRSKTARAIRGYHKKNNVSKLKIIRKLVVLVNVFLSIVITFDTYNDKNISLAIKLFASSFSFTIAILYIIFEIIVINARNLIGSLKWKKRKM